MTSTNKSYWLTSGIFTILQRFSTLVFNFGSTFLLFRIYSLEEFGVWGLFAMLISVIEVARSGLIQNALIRNLSISAPEEHPKIITASLTLNIILSGFTILLIVCGSHALSMYVLKAPDLELMLYFYIITTLILLPFFQFQYIQQANLDFRGVFWGMFFRQGLFFTGVATAFLFNYKPTLINLVHLQTLAAILGAIVGYIYAKKFFSFSRVIDKTWLRKLFDYGKYGFITNLSSIVSGSIDQGMLSNMISTSAVSLQRAALQITNAVEVPTNAMADVVFPQSARRMHTQGTEAIKYLYERSVGVIFAIIIPFLLIVLLFPEPIITIVTGGKEYLKSADILRVTALYTLIVPFDRQAGTIFDSTGKQKLNFYLQIGTMVINFTTNLFFINRYGIIGASYGTLVTYLTSFIIKQMILKKGYDVEISNIFKYSFKFYGEAYHILMQKIRRK